MPDIKNILYRNVYSQNCNQMMMIKSNGGSGSVQNAQFINFTGHTNAYTLDIDSDWSGQSKSSGAGVQLSDITFQNWKGTCSDGSSRAPIQALCPAGVPCTNITIDNFNVWTESGSSELFKCTNAYGTGGCLRSGTGGTYTSTVTVKTMT